MNKDNVIKCILIIIILVALWQIYKYFKHDTVTAEHMDNVDINDVLYSDWAPEPTPEPKKLRFIMKNNRYAVKNRKEIGSDNLKNNWDVDYQTGANNTCQDNVWHSISPRNVLIDNSMSCGDFKQDAMFSEPSGVASDLTSQIDGTYDGEQSSILFDEFLVPDLATGNKYSTCQNAGNIFSNQGCLNKKIYA